MPGETLLAGMGKFNEEFAEAGVMLAGDGLHPSKKGKRLRFSGGKTTVVDGPFGNTEELVAGFWIWKVKSMDEALDGNPMPGAAATLEIRPLFEMEDFAK